MSSGCLCMTTLLFCSHAINWTNRSGIPFGPNAWMLQSQENDMCGEVRIRANLTESTEVSQQSPSVTTKSQCHNKVPVSQQSPRFTSGDAIARWNSRRCSNSKSTFACLRVRGINEIEGLSLLRLGTPSTQA